MLLFALAPARLRPPRRPAASRRPPRTPILSGPQKAPGPSRTPAEKKAEIERIAKGFGVFPRQPGEELDRKYGGKPDDEESASGGLYTALVSTFGSKTLDAAEVAVLWSLGGLLAAFLALGLAISSAAFFSASSRPIPPALDGFLGTVEPAFTPLLAGFLLLSSAFGLYKQAQLNSGATGYEDKY